jgi:hypothetical protein
MFANVSHQPPQKPPLPSVALDSAVGWMALLGFSVSIHIGISLSTALSIFSSGRLVLSLPDTKSPERSRGFQFT